MNRQKLLLISAALFTAFVLSVSVPNTAVVDAEDVSDRIVVDSASSIWASGLTNVQVSTDVTELQTADASGRIMADGASCLWTADLMSTQVSSIYARITAQYADTMFVSSLTRPSSLPVATPKTPTAPPPTTPAAPSPEPPDEPVVTPQPPSTPGVTPKPSTPAPVEDDMISVYLYGQKTDILVGEEVILDLSAINLITKPAMTVQLILKVPSGMSVTSSGFIFGGGGQYTSSYTVEPGEAKLIEVHIIANQAGNFNVAGDICYYFGGNISTARYESTTLPVKVSAAQQSTPVYVPYTDDTQPSGFQMEPWVIPAAVIGGLLVILLIVLAVRTKH